MILLDTNILARITNSRDPLCVPSRNAVDRLRVGGEQLIIVPQNLYEFWAIATRPPGNPPAGENGLGMSTERAKAWAQFFCRRFVLLADREELSGVWLSLVASKRVTGYKCHDARLVAAMNTYQIQRILTLNRADFAALGITVVDPRSV